MPARKLPKYEFIRIRRVKLLNPPDYNYYFDYPGLIVPPLTYLVGNSVLK